MKRIRIISLFFSILSAIFLIISLIVQNGHTSLISSACALLCIFIVCCFLIRSRTIAEDLAPKYNVMIQRDVLASLLRGGMNTSRRNIQSFMTSALQFQSPYFVLLRINSEEYKNAVPDSDPQHTTQYYSMLSDLLEYVIPAYLPYSNRCRLTCFEGDYYMVINLLDVPEEIMITDSFIAYLEDCLEEACNYLNQTYHFSIQIDISSVYNGIHYLNIAYNEVCCLAEYGRLACITSPCLASHEAEFCQDKIDLVQLEINQAVKFRNALARNAYQQAGVILENMIDIFTHGSLENICKFRGYLAELLHLAYTCLEACDSEFCSDDHPELLQDREIETLDTLVELKRRTRESFDLLSAWYHNKLNLDGTKLQDVLDYINSNYHDYNLSANMICDVFGISASYLFRLFRDSNSTLLETIHKVRLDHAKQLLLNTTMTVDDISHEVGFAGRWSLIRSFKNYEDCTPTQYRENHRNQ